MCKNCDKNSIRTILSKIRLSDYSKHFPDDTYDPLEQLRYIEDMVEKFREEEYAENDKMRSIEEGMIKYKNDDNEIFTLKAAKDFYGLIHMHHDALRANMQIAMLAPAIESLYKRTLHILTKEKLGEKALNKFFDGKRFKGLKKGEKGYLGIVNSIVQILKELDFESNFQRDAELYLSALFDYRNTLFHNGLDWDEKECKALLEKHKKSWFTHHARPRKLYYFILPTKEFIDELINFFEESMDIFVKSK